jgi:eukaryotic-like serine/threonine-protein kinase
MSDHSGPSQGDSVSQSDILDEVLAEYLRAIESGGNPSRDDLLARYPELASELREFFANHDRMGRLARPLRDPMALARSGLSRETTHGFGDYELLEEVGHGGMGVIYKARQVSLNRIVALKMILAGRLANEQDIQRFRAEAAAAAKLEHSGIVPIFEIGQHCGQHYFSMKFVEGESLAKMAATGPLSPRRAAELVAQIAETVHFAHEQGIIHRDLKPSNVLLDQAGQPHVTDFGLAKELQGNSELTGTGQILGTPSYMPPEQAVGKSDSIGPTADVYSLGAILYCLLTGRPPFQAATPVDTLRQVLEQQPVSIRQLNGQVPLDLETIALKCLEKDPRRRYATADELVLELERYLDGRPILARPVGLSDRTWRWCRRNPVVAGLVGAVALALLSGTALSSYFAIDSNTNLRASEKANVEANARLWESLLGQARASRMTRQPGQRLDALRAIKEAYELPPPLGRSVDELRTEAIAALLLPDLEIAKKWEGCPAGTNSIALDANFERYARADWLDGNVSIRRVADDAEIHTLPGVGRVSSYGGLQFSPDGRFLSQRFESRQLGDRLWKLDGPQPVRLLDDGHIHCAFEPGGHRLAATYPDHTVRVLDLDTCRETRRFSNGVPGNSWLKWNPRHALLALGSGNGDVIQILDVDTGKVVRDVRFAAPLEWLEWHPEGEILAACTDLKIFLIDSRSGQQVLLPLEGHKVPGITCCFSHAGDWLVSTDWDGLLRIWDARTGQQLLEHEHAGAVVQFSQDDTLMGPFVSGTKVWLLQCYPSKGLRILLTGEPGFAGLAAHFAHEGRWLAASTHGAVSLIDMVRGRELAVLPLPRNSPLRFDPDDRSLWTAGDDGLLRWPIRPDPTDANVGRVGPPERLASLSSYSLWGASQDGTVLAVPNFSQGAILTNRSSGSVVPLGPQDDVRSAAVSPNKRWVATGSFDLRKGGGAKVWDAASGRHLADLPVSGFCQVHFSPDGKWLVTTGGGCRLWEAGTWREGAKLGSNNGSCAFSAGGDLLAFGDRIGELRLVIPETGREIARLTVSDATRLQPQCFTTDGAQLAAVGLDRQSLYLFDLRAIRQELQELKLDWDAPPLPPALPLPSKPSRLLVDLGSFREKAAADRLVTQADELTRFKKPAEALAALRLAIKTDPSHAMARDNLARLLLIGSKDLRDPKAALPLARKAVELAPSAPHYLNTLGVALYRNGEFKEGIAVLEKSLAAGMGETDAFDLFFLAMCDQRLGKKVAARDCFHRAVTWFEERRRNLPAKRIEELTTFQAEAEDQLARP